MEPSDDARHSQYKSLFPFYTPTAKSPNEIEMTQWRHEKEESALDIAEN
jgi:hypothetical protein